MVSAWWHPGHRALLALRGEFTSAWPAPDHGLPKCWQASYSEWPPAAPACAQQGLCGGQWDLKLTAARVVSSEQAIVDAAHAAKAKVCVATDLLALTQLTPPGEWGADMVVGSAQRFGVPMGYGGPHAAFLACHDEYKRLMPGRIIGAQPPPVAAALFMWLCQYCSTGLVAHLVDTLMAFTSGSYGIADS